MINKFLLLFMFLLPILSYAEETCPTPTQLQTGQLDGWIALSLDNAMPLSEQDLSEFRKKVKTFGLAEWMQSAPEGAAHCYYNGIKRDQAYLGVYFAKYHLASISSSAWQKMGDGLSQCLISLNACLFENAK